MTYLVNSIFYTVQGEGFWTGRPAVFVRFSRCNLWTGREQDRADAICRFCDTDFLHADRMSGPEIAAAVDSHPTGFVVFTGGEPALQLDRGLVDGLHHIGKYVAVETNGTRPLTEAVDWVCVSPKAQAPLHVRAGDELKLVYPQPGAEPEQFENLRFEHLWLSPMDGPDLAANTRAAAEYCLTHPRWRLNIQTHKVIGLP